MSLPQIRINGIRLGSRLNQVIQTSVNGEIPSVTPLYKCLAIDQTNILCLGLRTDASGVSVFCCHDLPSDLPPDLPSDIKKKVPPGSKEVSPIIVSEVCTVSVYPHNASLNTLGFLINLFGKNGVSFQQMVSSHAMISFIIDRSDQERVLTFLEQEFDLPPTHIPFEQFENENAEFVKKRYPETRATYVEQRIKTYGIKLDAGLEMVEIFFNPKDHKHLGFCGNGLQQLARSGKKFYFTASMTQPHDMASLYCLTEPLVPQEKQDFSFQTQADRGIAVCPSVSVDLISFHGPHFGDRFGIFNTAMACLNAAAIPVLLAGCTGASIFIALPDSLGEKALPALAEGFESP
jgi:aspartokinase